MSLLRYEIRDEDYAGKGISQLPAHPQYKTPDMQRKFDELVKDVAAPKHNALVQALAEENAAQHIGVKLQGIEAQNVAEALLFLKNTQGLPAGLPEGGEAGQVLANVGGVPQWKALSAADVPLADEAMLYEGGSVEEALLEAGRKLEDSMPKAGGVFTGGAAAWNENSTGAWLRNIEVVSGSIEEPAAVATNRIVMVRK